MAVPTSASHAPARAAGGLDELPAPVVAPQPLGARQHAFWTLQQLAPESTVSNLSVVLRTERPLRWWPLHAAFEHLVGRHPALRTRFPTSAGVPLVHVSAAEDVVLDVAVDAVDEAGLDARLRAESATPFDLGAELPVRVSLLQLDDGGTVLHLLIHHIVSDASSLAELTGELARIYDGVADGSGVPEELLAECPVVPEPPSDPDDVAYWTRTLAGVDLTGLALASARPAPARPTFAGTTYLADPLPGTVDALAVLRRLGGTNNVVMLAAFALALVRNGATPDLVLGVPVAGRGGAPGLSFRVSTLPLRLTVDLNAGFDALMKQARTAFFEGAEHASVSAEEIFAAAGAHSGDWRVPLFRHMFNYRPWDEADVVIGGERPGSLTVLRPQSRLDLQFGVLDRAPAPQFLVNHSTEIHDEADIRALLARMEILLQAAAEDPERPVGELDMATPDEARAMAAANATAAPEHLTTTLLDRFRATVAADPSAPAVLGDGETVTYGELAGSARRVAGALQEIGTGPGDVVALTLPRGAAALAAVLGVWTVGAAYLPIDARNPAQRIAAQLADVAVTAVIADSGSVVDGGGAPVLTWDGVQAGPETVGGSDPGVGDSAYVIHTSGSTGRPRGVVISHRSLANVVCAFASTMGLTRDDRVLWSTTTSFDISGLEMCLPLTVGAAVVVAGPTAQSHPRELLDTAVAHDVTVLQATPTFWRGAVEAGADALRGRVVLCGGEPLTADLANALLATGCRLFNVYGPTETTIWSTAAPIDALVEGPVPIGRPLANTTVAVVDEHGSRLPPGPLGELWIGGAGLATGYAGQPELTAERFPEEPDGRWYRTGDLARWRPDGTLELFGRNDRQVKVRGHRIELPEIETALRAHPAVGDAVAVVAGAGAPEAQLRVFVRLEPGATATTEELWNHLAARLPTAALPSAVQLVPSFPTTPNGKIDHGALRAADVAPAAAPQDAAGDSDPELTRRLVALWQEVLDLPGLDERAHFFLNGGHSLLATRLAGRIAGTEHREVPLRAVFDHPTPALMAGHLAGAEAAP